MLVQTQDLKNTRSYKHKIVQTQDRTKTISYISPGHRWYWPVTCPCSYGIASMFVRYCLYARIVLPPCPYGMTCILPHYPFLSRSQAVLTSDLSMILRYCLHACTLLPLTLSGYVGYDYHSTNIRSYIIHGHRLYWCVTCPGTYGIVPYSIWVHRCHHRNMSSATNFQFRFYSSNSSCANSWPLFLLKP